VNLLLVYANPYTTLWPQPAGLSMIARAAREAGHTVRLVDLMFEQDPDAVLQRALDETQPELVGLTLRNLDNADMKSPRSFVPDYVRWVGMASKVAPTIIGGPAVTAAPEPLLRRTGATYALAGQGEASFPVFLEELQAKAARFQAAGLIWRDGDGAIQCNPMDLSGHARGIDWSVIDRAKYQQRYMAHGLVTKSGCAHECAFCDAHWTSGPAFCARDPEAIVDNIRRDARDYQLNRCEYMLIDACFNQPVAWAKSLCEAIIRSKIKIGFAAVVEPTADLDAELCRLMVRAGSTMVTTLVGSYDDNVLAESARPFTAADVAHAFALFEEHHVLYMPQLMFGSPGETRQTVEHTVRQARRCTPIMLQGGYGVRVYPKAPLRARAVAEGVVSAEADLLDPTFYLAPGLDTAWLDAQIQSLGLSKLTTAPGWARYMWRLARLRW
jgi:radical SAM superfamily enzyme YgiQ (UPF0313 family)